MPSAITTNRPLEVPSAVLTQSRATGTIPGWPCLLFLRLIHVLPSATHILTLLAFVAHAVLGCCGHHGHAAGHSEAGMLAASGRAPSLADHAHNPCAHQTCCGHNADDANEAHTSDAQPADASPAADDAPVSDDSCPCDDSQDCQGNACAYVASDGKILSLPVKLLALDTAVTDTLLRRTFLQRDAQRFAAEVGWVRYRTSVALCALLQTWQV